MRRTRSQIHLAHCHLPAEWDHHPRKPRTRPSNICPLTSSCASVSSIRARVPNPEYTPIRPDAYGQYFAQALQIELPTRGLVVRAYHTLLRGSGVMIMHHGAGYSALSFACLAKELNDSIGKDVGVLAFDARRHGESVSFYLVHWFESVLLQGRPSRWRVSRMRIYRWTSWWMIWLHSSSQFLRTQRLPLCLW